METVKLQSVEKQTHHHRTREIKKCDLEKNTSIDGELGRCPAAPAACYNLPSQAFPAVFCLSMKVHPGEWLQSAWTSFKLITEVLQCVPFLQLARDAPA